MSLSQRLKNKDKDIPSKRYKSNTRIAFLISVILHSIVLSSGYFFQSDYKNQNVTQQKQEEKYKDKEMEKFDRKYEYLKRQIRAYGLSRHSPSLEEYPPPKNYHPKFHYDRIDKTNLFYFLNLLDDVWKQPKKDKDVIVIEFLPFQLEPKNVVAKPKAKPPLKVTDRRIQDIIDDYYYKGGKLQKFKEEYLDKYNANEGDLYKLFREYHYQNGIEAVVERDFSRLLIELYEASVNDKELIDYCLSYAKQNYGSRTGIECLFYIDKLIQIEEDRLLLTKEMYPFVKTELLTKENLYPFANSELNQRLSEDNANTYKTIVSVYEKYQPLLQQKGLNSEEDIHKKYAQKRIEFSRKIIEQDKFTDYYRVNDTLFKIGEIYFIEGDFNKAFYYWKEIENSRDSGYFRHKRAYNTIWNIINRGEECFKDHQTELLIADILSQERYRHSKVVYQRTKKFVWKE